METNENNLPADHSRGTAFPRRLWVQYTFFFLIGAIVGALIGMLVVPMSPVESVTSEEIRGTLYSSGSYDKMKPADAIFFDQPNLRAAVQVRYSTQLVEARMNLSSREHVKLVVEFSYSDFRVLNVQNLTGGDQSTILSASNVVQIDNLGESEYVVQWSNLNRLPHQLVFRFYQNDVPFYTNSVQVNQE